MSRKRNIQPELKSFDVQWEAKAKAQGGGEVTGYASVFGVIDLHGDVIEKGAFKRTIQNRVASGKVKLFDSHVPDSRHTLGTVVEAREDEIGLWFRAELSSAESVKDTKTKMLEGHLSKASIGFDIVKQRFESREGMNIRVIEEVMLFEISVVPIPANELATISAKGLVKALPVPFQDLPMAEDDQDWDPEAARERVEAWAKGDEAKLRRAHLALIPGKGYDALIADVVDGELVAVPRALKLFLAQADGLREHALKYLGTNGSSPTKSDSQIPALADEPPIEPTASPDPPVTALTEDAPDTLKKSRRRELELRVRHALASEVSPNGSCERTHQRMA